MAFSSVERGILALQGPLFACPDEAQVQTLKCLHCRELFAPDYRNRERQKYCSKPECQRASKRASQQRWFQKPENRDYFRDQENIERVRKWRPAHPGYWKRSGQKKAAPLQDPCPDPSAENPRARAGSGFCVRTPVKRSLDYAASFGGGADRANHGLCVTRGHRPNHPLFDS